MELAAHPFWDNLPEDKLAPLLVVTQVNEFERTTVIFDEGSISDGLYLVLTGTVVFKKNTPQGGSLTVNRCEAGAHFGEIGILSELPRSLRAEAQAGSKLAFIPGDALMKLLQKMEGPVEKILRSVIGHLHNTTHHYVHEIVKQEKLALVGGMMNSIIHDFKNPFCLISLSTQLLQQKHPDADTQRICRNIENQIKRMVQMANDLAAYSRGQAELNFEPVPLASFIEEYKSLNLLSFQNEKYAIRFKVPEVILKADKAKLMRVVQNLLANAFEAMQSDGGKLTVTGEMLRDQSQIELCFSDTGGGIPAEVGDRLFEPFVTYGKVNGTGLGMAIVKSIVDAHDGKIRYTTKPGKGTSFYITLPLWTEDQPEPSRSNEK